MERSEAEAIYAQGREPVVDVLLALSARLEAQEAQLAAHSGRSPTSPTSNRPTTPPERGLRAAVIYRKLSLGSRSQGGERTIERLLSVDQTCRVQRRSLYAYLSEALSAKARGDPVPSLA